MNTGYVAALITLLVVAVASYSVFSNGNVEWPQLPSSNVPYGTSSIKNILENPEEYGQVKIKGKLYLDILPGPDRYYLVDEQGYRIYLTHLPDKNNREYQEGVVYTVEGNIIIIIQTGRNWRDISIDPASMIKQ